MRKDKLLALLSSLCLVLIFVVILFTVACAKPAPTPAPTPTPALTPTPTATPTLTPTPTTSPTPTTTPATGKVWNLRYATDAPSGPMVDRQLAWADRVDKATNGRVKVRIYAGATLCQGKDTLAAVKGGVTDFGQAITGYWPGGYPLTEVILLPFAGKSGEINSLTLWQLYQEFPAIQAEYADVKLIGLMASESYPLATTKKPVRNLEDIKGLKIRAAGGPPTDLTKTLGAVPVTIAMPDTYLSLQKGVVDGLWFSYSSINAFRFHEVTKYVTDVPTSPTVQWLILNLNVWNSFPPDIQNQVMTLGGETFAREWGRDHWDYYRNSLSDVLKQQGISGLPTSYNRHAYKTDQCHNKTNRHAGE